MNLEIKKETIVFRKHFNSIFCIIKSSGIRNIPQCDRPIIILIIRNTKTFRSFHYM